jgi:hypothetical protein
MLSDSDIVAAIMKSRGFLEQLWEQVIKEIIE